MANFKKIISWLLVVFLMAAIFFLSHQPIQESKDLTTRTKTVIKDTAEKVLPIDSFEISNFSHKLRKSAHFMGYLLLSLLLMLAFKSVGVAGYKKVGLTLLICLLFAISDEVHQLFVEGRGGQLRDVVLDFFGSIVGVGIYRGIEFMWRK